MQSDNIDPEEQLVLLEQQQREYERLRKKVRDATVFLSVTGKLADYPGGQEIIDMGLKAIPHFIADFQEFGHRDLIAPTWSWFQHLYDMTGTNVVLPQHRGRYYMVKHSYIYWAMTEGLGILYEGAAQEIDECQAHPSYKDEHPTFRWLVEFDQANLVSYAMRDIVRLKQKSWQDPDLAAAHLHWRCRLVYEYRKDLHPILPRLEYGDLKGVDSYLKERDKHPDLFNRKPSTMWNE